MASKMVRGKGRWIGVVRGGVGGGMVKDKKVWKESRLAKGGIKKDRAFLKGAGSVVRMEALRQGSKVAARKEDVNRQCQFRGKMQDPGLWAMGNRLVRAWVADCALRSIRRP